MAVARRVTPSRGGFGGGGQRQADVGGASGAERVAGNHSYASFEHQAAGEFQSAQDAAADVGHEVEGAGGPDMADSFLAE